MRIEANPYLSALAFTFNQTRAGEASAANSAETADYRVQISREAREAYSAQALGVKNDGGQRKEENKVRDDFLQYLEKARKASKSKEEQIKELKGKLNKLQAEMAEVAADQGLPEEVKKPKLETLNTQITHIAKQIAELSKELGGDAASA